MNRWRGLGAMDSSGGAGADWLHWSRRTSPTSQESTLGRIVVEVMPKPEILDPQGKAVMGSLPRIGLTGFTGVRQGRRFELAVAGPVTQEHLDAAAQAASTLLSNPIIEDVVSIHVAEED